MQREYRDRWSRTGEIIDVGSSCECVWNSDNHVHAGDGDRAAEQNLERGAGVGEREYWRSRCGPSQVVHVGTARVVGAGIIQRGSDYNPVTSDGCRQTKKIRLRWSRVIKRRHWNGRCMTGQIVNVGTTCIVD